jgi:hypothetical protein
VQQVGFRQPLVTIATLETSFFLSPWVAVGVVTGTETTAKWVEVFHDVGAAANAGSGREQRKTMHEDWFERDIGVEREVSRQLVDGRISEPR